MSRLDPKTVYVFKVRAESNAGPSPDSELSDLIETLVPISMPGKPCASKVTHNCITLTWDKPEQGADIVEQYTVLYRSSCDDPNNWCAKSCKDFSFQRCISIPNLVSKTSYIFKVRAESTAGPSPDSLLSDPIETLLPISQPGKPCASEVTHNSVILQWAKPERGADIVRHYIIFYSSIHGSAGSHHTPDASKKQAPFEVVNIQNLKSDTRYTFKVRAESTAGPSPDSVLSDPIETLVPISQPGKPCSTKVTHDSIVLNWDKPKQGAQTLSFYTIIYHSADDSDNWSTRKVSGKEEHTILSRLDPKTVYFVKVKAETIAGSISVSELSDPIETMLLPPGKPRASQITYKGFQVNWERPAYSGIQHYSVSYQATDDPPDLWGTIVTTDDTTNIQFPGAEEKLYVFKVAAVTDEGKSSDSDLSDPIETTTVP